VHLVGIKIRNYINVDFLEDRFQYYLLIWVIFSFQLCYVNLFSRKRRGILLC